MKNIVLNNAKQLGFETDWLEKTEAAMDAICADVEKTAALKGYVEGLLSAEKQEATAEALRAAGDTLGIANTVWAMVAMLAAMEETKKEYARLNLPEKVYWDTFRDIYIWVKTWQEKTGEVGLYEVNWTKKHLLCTIFRLGRLQFEFSSADETLANAELPGGVKLSEGDPMLGMHIPRDEKLTEALCEDSYRQAAEFFPKYFPDFDFKGVKCSTWLFDPRLGNLLPKNSNILAFAARFHITKVWDDLAFPFRFLFEEKPENIDSIVPKSSLGRNAIKWVKDGNMLGAAQGFLARNEMIR